MAMDQYLYIPFLGGWTSIYQLFWGSPGVQGFDPSPYNNHISTIINHHLARHRRWGNIFCPRNPSFAPRCRSSACPAQARPSASTNPWRSFEDRRPWTSSGTSATSQMKKIHPRNGWGFDGRKNMEVWSNMGYPPVIKRGNWKSPNGNIIYKWWIFHCQAWLQEGSLKQSQFWRKFHAICGSKK